MTLQEKILAHAETLSEDRQREVLAIIQSIAARGPRPEENVAPPRESASSRPVSVLDLALAHGIVGCVKDAPVDLSVNKDYMQGYGE
uniref:Uncharacterized protein n=1 Tax=Candidatus Kentrum sp. TC TaxID=2126339 RepID=A0A450YQD1_9GAMM|nr:MAG: hypothetical protein BECKTC1821E_GA0114239_1001167 [Candidatus Kentron sp. TC]VFK43750.1 MAG: hypothetical protein BECKTC1821D_GA0114238_101817 [Candidatus Kentron sp. TC]VFK51254.1 MAG: hypothetical protein BECKTC1821F_GA0114240_100115 [Candidatus Kentron sp. TC]